MALLREPERADLAALGVTRMFPPGSVLMFEREPGERVMVLLSGRVKVTQTDQNGRESLLSIRDPGDVLGELAFIDGKPRLATVSALEVVNALVLDSGRFRRHLETTPRVAVALLEVMTERFRETTLKRVQVSSSDTLGRVCARLMELAERYGEAAESGILLASPLSYDEMVAWTGASRAGVAHALQEMRELGWITTERRQITLRRPELVRNRAA